MKKKKNQKSPTSSIRERVCVCVFEREREIVYVREREKIDIESDERTNRETAFQKGFFSLFVDNLELGVIAFSCFS